MTAGINRYLSDLGIAAATERRTGESTSRRQAQSPASAENSSDEGYTATAETPMDAMATKQTFLTLLVAQIKNQNPLNPADGTEFLSQLAQFSELEQLISIRQELESMNATPGTRTDGSTDGAPASAGRHLG